MGIEYRTEIICGWLIEEDKGPKDQISLRIKGTDSVFLIGDESEIYDAWEFESCRIARVGNFWGDGQDVHRYIGESLKTLDAMRDDGPCLTNLADLVIPSEVIEFGNKHNLSQPDVWLAYTIY